MDLNFVQLKGFKRFENANLKTWGKIIALVGANESGKTSILEALSYLSNDTPFNSTDLSRNKEFKDSDLIIEAGFLLDNEDKQAISHLHGYDSVKWFYITKQASGKRNFDIDPKLLKNWSYCEKVNIEIQNLYTKIKSKYREKIPLAPIKHKEEVEGELPTQEKFRNLLIAISEYLIIQKNKNKKDILALEASMIKLNKILYEIEDWGIEDIRGPVIVSYLTDAIQKLFEYENSIKANKKAIEILKDRIPQFLFFTEEARDLTSRFNLSDIDKSRPTLGLTNLLKIAKLDLKELHSHLFSNRPLLKSKINKANHQIKKIFQGKWSQSHVRPKIELDYSTLTVFIENNDLDYFEINQRSQGLRQFMALISFLEANDSEQPILLIDEAELHLHYDAQADLINIFSQQQFTSKIIYTTHSVGCLPEDLGTSIKLVYPEKGKEERSEISSKFWSKQGQYVAGILPLFSAMGASNLAFMALRKSLFVEGETDMMLFPTIFRQVSNRDYLGFQTLSKIANEKEDYGLLKNHAPKIAFLVDRDKEGDDYRDKLLEAKYDENIIFQLPECGEREVLEDYLSEDLYVKAINEELKIKKPDISESDLLKTSDLTDKNRPKQVKKWVNNKVQISDRLLSFVMEDPSQELIDPACKRCFY